MEEFHNVENVYIFSKINVFVIVLEIVMAMIN